jgi:hypothetical protein
MTKRRHIHNRESIPGRLKRMIAFFPLIFFPLLLLGQNEDRPAAPRADSRTILTDTIRNPKADSVSKSFYDSVYRKFGRHKFSQFLYTLVFVPPKTFSLPDTLQNIRSEDLYMKYKGKIIRRIQIKTLDPFGPTVADTAGLPATRFGRAGDKTHMTTRKFVIRKNLLFKKGQPVDPYVLADNEKLLRDLPALDDVRIILSPTDPSGDSVDIMVVTKDVFSIGFDLLTVTPGSSVFRLYDGNLLGLGDRFVNEFSIDNQRAPFLRENGVNYYLNNIGGTFIDGQANYFHDDIGNQHAGFLFTRSFFSNRTRWAGSGMFQYLRDVNKPNDSVKITSFSHYENLWIGRAFFLKTRAEPLRLIISEVAYTHNYFSRPGITADSNKQYYNYLKLFSGFSISRNKYYLTDYVFEMGKRENIPYGYLFQLTLGPEFTDFYTRFYSGIEASGGDFIKKFGYLSGRIAFGGYLHGDLFEDVILKVQTSYMTYLFYTPGKRYRFRCYLISDYRKGFNFRLNNNDSYDIKQNLQIYKTTADQNLLQGTESLTGNLSLLVYTPWSFYSFRFALLGQLQGGYISRKNTPLFTTSFYPGIRAGLILKNDNLIFPAIVFSLFFYPTTPSGGSWIQYMVDINTGLHFPDFNVSAPKEESLQN